MAKRVEEDYAARGIPIDLLAESRHFDIGVAAPNVDIRSRELERRLIQRGNVFRAALDENESVKRRID